MEGATEAEGGTKDTAGGGQGTRQVEGVCVGNSGQIPSMTVGKQAVRRGRDGACSTLEGAVADGLSWYVPHG